MHEASYYREQAARARCLADAPIDRETQELLQRMAQDYSEIAEDLENGAIEIRHRELMPPRSRTNNAD